MSDDHYKETLMGHMVFQPKGVSWVTEVDIACHDDKQYMRKTYHSTMDLAKELQLDADVFSDECPSPRENSQIDCNTPLQESDHTDQEEKQTPNDLLASNSKVMGHKLTPDVFHDSKVPPRKPPRKSQLSVQQSLPVQLKKTEIVTISSRPRSPGVQTRFLLTTPDIPSIMEAGSRVSSFTPHTSTSRPCGHSRSKSESLKVDKLNLIDTGFQDPSIAVALGGIVTDPKSFSVHVASPQSSTRSKSPSKYATRSKSPSELATSPKSPSQHATSPRSPSKHATSPKSPFSREKPKSPTFGDSQNLVRGEGYTQQDVPSKTLIRQGDITTGRSVEKSDKQTILRHPAGYPQSPVDDLKERHADADGSEELSKGVYQDMLKELGSHKIMSCLGHLKSVNDKNMEEVEAVPSNAEFKEEFNENANSSDGKVEEYLSQKARQEGCFSISQGIYSSSQVMMGRPVLNFHNKSLTQVRRSTFISQDEVGSILEDKSLSSMTRHTPSEEDNPVLVGGVVDLVSPLCLTHDKSCGIQSDQDESSFNDDTENTSPTLPFQFISSGYSREHKRFQDSEKTEDCDDSSGDGKGDSINRPTSPPESLRISTILENLQELSENIAKEGFLHRTFLLREGKKVRKNWTQSYARYIVGTFNSGSSGLVYFSKTKDEDKKAEMFEFFPTCHLEHTPDKKTSRQQVLGLRNGRDTEVLLQFDDKDIADEWFKVLVDHEGMQYSDPPVTEKEEKKGKRGFEKIKREASVEHLNHDSKGITDKLRNFIKRRPLKETLEKKGIYRESVFGSTLAELSVQDKTAIPIFVLQCINHIEKSVENLRTDGLYRISGNAAQIQKIRFEVAQRNYIVLSQEKEIHNLSGALKLFFRELKEPLIPFDNYQEFIQATGSEYRRMNQQADKLTKAVNRLPPENCETLKVLLQHLLRVSEFESENRMSISNLAIVFGPCLLWPRVTLSHDLMTDVMLHNRVVEGLLSDFFKIFPSKR